MEQHTQHAHALRAPRLTADELWYLGFLQWAEHVIAKGGRPCHDRPISVILRCQGGLAAQGLVRYVGPREPIPSVELTELGRMIDHRCKPNDHPPGIFPDEVPEMEVCHDCGQVVGRFYRSHFGHRVQYGSCRDHTAPEAANSGWPRYDFKLHVDLCRCCGRVPLRSGSKWSVWFCKECKEQIGLLNGRHGRCVVPIGRHSVHAGHLLAGDQAGDPVAVETFLSSMKGIFSVHGPLADWMREAVRRNFRDAGFPPDRPVPLDEYWASVRAGVDPDDRFREMCGFLEEAGRQAAGREAR